MDPRYEDSQVSQSPDRAILINSLLPAFASYDPILWVGCRGYTQSYYDILEQQGAVCWTLDVDSAAAAWGRSGRHVVGNLLEVDLYFPGCNFAAVLCNGVLGWGIDRITDQRLAVQAIWSALQPGGLLLLGWNTDKIADPITTGLTRPLFQHSPLNHIPPRITVAGCTHVYDNLLRRDSTKRLNSGPAIPI